MRYFQQHVLLYCTRTIMRHMYSGIFKDPLNRKCKSFKNFMFYWSISLKVVKLNPSMQQMSMRCKSKKNITWNCSMACWDNKGLLSLSRYSVWAVFVVCLYSLLFSLYSLSCMVVYPVISTLYFHQRIRIKGRVMALVWHEEASRTDL